MDSKVPSGRYVIAVSGGVDSMVLLHLLQQQAGLELVVAHYDHGIRPDSFLDCDFVAAVAGHYNISFESEAGQLGATASEATARAARYTFLKGVQTKNAAAAIITAHHQDDVLETAIINMSRGTGRRGLTSLANTTDVVRPLLDMPKAKLLDYAAQQGLEWREDSTNKDDNYLRNYIRHQVIPKFNTAQRQQFLGYLNTARDIGKQLDQDLEICLSHTMTDNKLDRKLVAALPEPVVKELLMAWWRKNKFYSYESKTLVRAVANVRTGKTGAIVPLKGALSMTVGRTQLALHNDER